MSAPNLTHDVFANARILVVGDVMLDRYWFGSVDRISPEAPVPVLAVAREEARAGGAANVAHNVASLGGMCTLLSVVGADADGKDLQQIVQSQGVRSQLLADESMSTIVKLRMVAQNQQLLRVDFDRPPSKEVLARCLEGYSRVIGDHDVVILSDYGKGGLSHVEAMIQSAREHGKPVIIDPKGADYSRYRGATLITPNMKEFETVVGKVTSEAELTEKALRLKSDLELTALLVTRSEKGMTLIDANDQRVDSPATALEVYDVSGAGDTVIALMALAHANGMTSQQSLDLANLVAGIVVGKLGTAVTTMSEVLTKHSTRSEERKK